MWKKEEEQTTAPKRDPGVEAAGSRRQEPSLGTATLGPSIRIDGDVTGSEDLVIQGHVDGSVTLDDNAVSVGKEGRVHADIRGRIIIIEGRVEGDLTAREQIVLRGSAQVKGDIKAPRVVLEDGATFRGLVDMGAAEADGGDKARKSTSGRSSEEDGASAGARGSGSSSGSTGASGKASDEPKAESGKDGDSGKGGASEGKKATQKAGA